MLVCGALALTGCSIAPQLAPTAAGCYAVQLDSVPAQFAELLIPPAPEFVRLDTAHGGQVQVPRAWFEADGYRVRRASLELTRPGWRIANGLLVLERSRPLPLPADTLILNFGGGTASLTALVGAEPTGDWRGWAFALSSETPYGQPMVPVRLQRSTCGPTPMAITP
ncbi:MAG: hypothetical protein MUF40_02785 [Gemmatimonadaceae bacterium]|nr:hypothetical protein [Gemmatimonadaceae bacterium]